LSDFGCGDGNILGYLNVDKYYGYDISKKSIEICSNKYRSDKNKHFQVYQSEIFRYVNRISTDLSLSLDVIYHLLEDETYDNYMTDLFNSSLRFVLIYSNNSKDKKSYASHIHCHKFTDWVRNNMPEWNLVGFYPNRYPFIGNVNANSSFCNFYFFSKNEKIDHKYAIYFSDSKVVPSQSNVNIQSLMEDSLAAIKNNNHNKAIELFKTVLSVDPYNIKVLHNMGMCLFTVGKMDDAEEAWKAVLAENQYFSISRMALANLYLQQNRWEELNYFYNELAKHYLKTPEIQKIWSFLKTKIEYLNYINFQ
jgi:tetratricopeptide (TPR) repeat protein